jgi:hypothetical protein
MTGVAIGTAIVSYIEPHPGHAVEFNRWYERDHFPATVKAGPGVFAGGRFVATRECKELRPPAGRLLGDPGRGSYLGLAWVLPEKQAEWDAWVAREMETIAREDRLFAHRDHVHTAVYRAEGDAAAPGAVVALDRGHAGLIAVADDKRLAVPSGPVDALVILRLERTILSEADPPPHEFALAFCADPLGVFSGMRAELDGAGFASPFLATIPGTDTYAADL